MSEESTRERELTQVEVLGQPVQAMWQCSGDDGKAGCGQRCIDTWNGAVAGRARVGGTGPGQGRPR